jgi:hypothetical protein
LQQSPRSLAERANVTQDALAGFDKLAIWGSQGNADMTGAARPEAVARECRHNLSQGTAVSCQAYWRWSRNSSVMALWRRKTDAWDNQNAAMLKGRPKKKMCRQ